MDRPVSNRDGDEVIRSSGNATIAFVRSLQRRNRRAEARAFVVEGRRAVADAIAAGACPILVLVREGGEAVLPSLGAAPPVRFRTVSPRLFDALGDTVTPQGVLAVVPFPDLPMPSDSPSPPLFLVLDRIRDPGNLGTLLRAAAGAGVTAVYRSAESVDLYNPKVVRAGMGAHFRVPTRDFSADVADELVRRCPLRVVATADAPVSYDSLDWRQPAALIVGSEGAGVGAEVAALGSVAASIGLARDVESLNVAVAGAVILFEAVRQRRFSATAVHPFEDPRTQ